MENDGVKRRKSVRVKVKNKYTNKMSRYLYSLFLNPKKRSFKIVFINVIKLPGTLDTVSFMENIKFLR